MFSATKKKVTYLAEDEPPPKKLITEGDIIIKELSERQMSTNTSLAEQLKYKKEFQSTAQCSELTDINGGTHSLSELQDTLKSFDNINYLKTKKLSDADIKLYLSFKNDQKMFLEQHRHVNLDILEDRVKAIEDAIHTKEKNCCKDESSLISKHDLEYIRAMKPDSLETKLLAFTLRNKNPEAEITHPINELPDLESSLLEKVSIFSNCDIKKIRKKSRQLAKKVDRVGSKDVKAASSQPRTSLWDCKESTQNQPKPHVIDKDKVFTCKAQVFYTIRNGEIIKLSDSKVGKIPVCTKLSIEEIKQIPKFKNYEPGVPSKKLFLKNLPRNVKEIDLRILLEEKNITNLVSIKIMEGKMKGQVFVEFNDEKEAANCLEAINGVYFGQKPIVVTFGRKKDDT